MRSTHRTCGGNHVSCQSTSIGVAAEVEEGCRRRTKHVEKILNKHRRWRPTYLVKAGIGYRGCARAHFAHPLSMGGSSYATAQQNVQTSGHQEYEDNVDATIDITTRIMDTIPLWVPDFSEEHVRQARSMIPADVIKMRLWFCRVLRHSIYTCPCLSPRLQTYCAYHALMARREATTSPKRSRSRESTTPCSGYWPDGGEAQHGHGRRGEAWWGDQHSRVHSRKKPHARVEYKSSVVLAVPIEIPAPPQIHSNLAHDV